MIYVALRAFILSLVEVPVIQGLANSVSTPIGGFIAITEVGQTRLATNHTIYDDSAQSKRIEQPTSWGVQVDCYGNGAGDWANIISTMVRDEYACLLMAQYGVQPLYADDPKSMPLVTGEENYEQRFTFNVMLQSAASVTVPQQSANDLTVGIINVETTYPPDEA